jgi:hypothetical protein
MAFALSWVPRPPFSATEARELVVHNGKLYCATGQWHILAGAHPGPQIIRLDSPGGAWTVEATFASDTIAVSCLSEIHFPTANLTTLVCGFFGRAYVGVRNDGWSLTRVGGGGQIRSFAAHKDNRTGVNMAFAGQDEGIFAGVYDTTLPGEIMWATTPELDISGFPPMQGGHPERVMSMAEIGSTLYATVGQRLYRRNDGHPSSWTKVWENLLPGSSQSGLRGLTAFNGDLWLCVEGTESRVVKIDPATYEATTALDLSGGNDFYIIGAYNDMCVTDVGGSPLLMFGVDAGAASPAHFWRLYQGAWARVTLPQFTATPMRSCRTICTYGGDVYYGGFDCYNDRATNTAWIVKSTLADAVA